MRNQDWLSRSLAAVWHPCTQMKHHQHAALPLVPISHGKGAWLYDFDGNRYLDGVSSWWVNLFGHSNPRINAAITDQLWQLEHVMLAGFTQRPVVELSERLAALTAQACPSAAALGHCFYASDGASATEIALKMSMHYWRNCGRPNKTRFVSLAGSYHGETAGALAVTDIALFREAYAPLITPGETVPAPDSRHANTQQTAGDIAERAAQALDAWLATHHEQTAALIVEPLVQCAAGMVMYDPLYLKRARELCNQYDVHLITDEIAVGCGRTGTFFAYEQAQIQPDFLCLSKGISGGYLPLSVVLTTDEIYRAFYADDVARGFLHSHSYTGNALACRAALATLDIFEQDHVLQTNVARASHMLQCAASLTSHPSVSNMRQRGMILAFDIANAPKDFARRFFANGLRNEILLRPITTEHGCTVYFMPPYILDDGEIALLCERTLLTLDQTFKGSV